MEALTDEEREAKVEALEQQTEQEEAEKKEPNNNTLLEIKEENLIRKKNLKIVLKK
ncbi:hypothetical protein [Flavobacterium sp. HNIBRBA15423]|uniref:hypothetical protein n=1 Tax=Flavobacterium sp. HNIBRBA15423 TaxID=3458683 RepID=UPI0040442E2C